MVLEGEPLKKTRPAQRGAGQPVEVSPVVAHLLDAFHLLGQDVALQAVTELRSSAGRAQGLKAQKGQVSFFSRTAAAFTRPECHPAHCGTTLEGAQPLASFASSRDAQRPEASSGPTLRSVPCPDHSVEVAPEAQREVGMGGPQCGVTRWWGGLPLGAILLTHLGACGS